MVAATISAGAIAMSAFLVYAAFAALDSRMRFDAARQRFQYRETGPLVRTRTVELPLAQLVRVEVGTEDWSEGSPSYHLEVVSAGGRVFASGSSWSRGEIEILRDRVEAFLTRLGDLHPPDGPPSQGPRSGQPSGPASAAPPGGSSR